ncbi:MAG: hypothetical protein WKF50_02430, partial [Nocardioides sp.]
LAQLEALLPEEAQDELVYAAEVLGDIDAAAGQACPSCRGGITQIPPMLYSAGQVAENPVVVVVPAPLVEKGRPSTDGGPKSNDDKGPKQDDGPEDDEPEDDGDPLTGPTIAPDPGDAGTDAGTGDDPTNPLEVLTDPVTGQGGGQTSDGGGQTSNGGGLPGVPEVDDVIDSVDDSLPEIP